MKYILIILLLAASLSAHAGEPALHDGYGLLQACTSSTKGVTGLADANYAGYKQGYCFATTDAAIWVTLTRTDICVPAGGIKYGQAELIIVKYLNEHPESLHVSAVALVIRAYREAFPCTEK